MKYLGSKKNCKGIARIINELLPEGGVYWEPFLGSAKVMQHVRCRFRYGSDVDPHIIDLLRAVQAGWEPPDDVSEEEWRHWREVWKKGGERRHPMIGFCVYGCSHLGSPEGGYARSAKGENFALQAKRSLLRQKPMLDGVVLFTKDYRGTPQVVEHSDVIYCDPPYAGTRAVGRKGDFDATVFWSWAERVSRWAVVLVSEYDCPVPGASVVWEKSSSHGTKGADGRQQTQVEKLYCLDRRVSRSVGLGLF